MQQKIITIYFLLTTIVALQFRLHAQSGAINVPPRVVIIDAHSRAVLQAAPFDRSFILMLPVDTTLELDEIKQLDLFKIKSRTDAFKTVPPRILSYDSNDLKGASFVDTPKVAKKKYLKILINTQLEPNIRFSVVIYLKPSHEYLDQLNKINQMIFETHKEDARENYEKLSSGLTVKFGTTKAEWPKFTDYLSYYQDNLQTQYQRVDAIDPNILITLEKIANALRTSGVGANQSFGRNWEKSPIANKLLSDSARMLVPLQNLLLTPDTALKATLGFFAEGRLNIQEFASSQPIKKIDFQTRIDNLHRLWTSLGVLSYDLNTYADSLKPATRTAVADWVQEAIPIIKNQEDTLKDASKKIRTGINNNYGLFSAEVAFGGASPIGEDLQTASGHYIIPDFGLATFTTRVNNQSLTTIRPYLGVNFSFTAIDKNVPLSQVKHKKLLHHLSFVVGLTTTALTRQGTTDLIKTMSVVCGIGIRVNNAFRITAGTLIYKRDNLNPDLPQQTAFGPMLALSLDLDLMKWIGDLKTIF